MARWSSSSNTIRHPYGRNKQLMQTAKQLNEPTIDPNSTSLLWVDDIAMITDNMNDQKTLLETTEEMAEK